MDCKDDFDDGLDMNANNCSLNDLLKNVEFERYAQEYLSEKSKKMQRECYNLQQKILFLEESQKAQKENVEHLHTEIEDKNNQILRLEHEVNTLNVSEQGLMTEIAKLKMNLNHNDEVMHSMKSQLVEYQCQNEMLSQKIHEMNMNMNTDLNVNEHENVMAEESQSMDHQNIESLEEHLDTIRRLMDENTDLKTKVMSLESEQETNSLNNAALNNLMEAKAMSLKNIQKQHQMIKNKYNESRQLNEQYVMSMNAKDETILRLKEQNESLETLNDETMKINHDLRHELEQTKFVQGIANENSVEPTNEQKAVNKRRVSCDDDEEKASPSPLLLGKKSEDEQRRFSAPSSLYDQNLDFMVKAVTKDEFTFLEDLAKEKSTNKSRKIRSKMLKKYHCDAEKEFFHMMVLTVKLEISTKREITNAVLSDVSANALWLLAQQNHVAMHQFHDFVLKSLLSVLSANKKRNEPVIAQWNSFNSMIADELRQNDLKKYKKNNPHLKVVDPEEIDAPKPQKHGKFKANKTRIIQKQRALTEQPYSEKQLYFDEDEDEIYAAMNKSGSAKRRDSQKLKKTIIQSYINNEAHQMQHDYDLL